MTRRGAVICEEAYAQGKVLDNSGWGDILPRNVTPSDIDLNFDNNGYVLLCELSSSCTAWTALKVGQRKLYEALVARGQIAASLLKHDVPKTRKIDTLKDIESFQVMTLADSGLMLSQVYHGRRWKKFVSAWYERPEHVYASCQKITQVGVEPFRGSPLGLTAEELNDQQMYWRRT